MNKQIYNEKLLLLIIGILFLTPASSHSRIFSMHQGWTVTEGEKKYKATIPTTAMGVLIKNGLYQNILSGLNYNKIDKTEFHHPWIFSRNFDLPALTSDQRILLQISGIDYRADIKINGHLVASHDTLEGPFRHFLLDITPSVRKKNRIDITVYRAQDGDPNYGYADWNIRPADESMGITRNINLIIADRVVIEHTAVFSKVNTVTLSKAALTITTTLRNVTGKKLLGLLEGSFEAGKFRVPVVLQPHQERTITLDTSVLPILNIDHPRLWWCTGMGEPELYHLRLRFVASGETLDSKNCTFGIRQIDSYLTEDGYRAFLLNGRKVMINGGGWTDDIFMQDTPESYRQQMIMIHDMGLNTIRMEGFWGTCDQAFSICDSLGLMIMAGWSCQWEWNADLHSGVQNEHSSIPDTPEMKRLLTLSLRDQVLALRQHPSIICWFIGSDKCPYTSWEQSYHEMLNGLDDRPLQISAANRTSEISGPSGVKMTGPYEYVGPSYYFTDHKSGGAFGFNTETSIGASMPVQEDVDRIVGKDEDWPVKDNIYYNYHCTASSIAMKDLNVISSVIQNRFGEIGNLRKYLQCANLLSYESTQAMYEAYRTAEPLTTGIIQWKLNSAWPSFYWQLYDYYGVPTAAYYGTKKANQVFQLTYNYGCHKVYAVNKSLKDVTGNAQMKFYDLHSHLIKNLVKKITLSPHHPQEVFDLNDIKMNGELFLKLTDQNGVTSRGEYWVPADSDTYDWKKGNWYITPILHYASYQALLSLPSSKLKISTSTYNGEISVKIHNSDKNLAFFIELVLLNAKGLPVPYSRWSDNYFTLSPGQTRNFSCIYPGKSIPSAIMIRPWNSKPLTVLLKKNKWQSKTNDHPLYDN
jgi:exo-1,4-beta-D-glucosaminidase